MLSDTLQHIDEILIRIDAVQATGDDQALNDTDMLGAEFRPAEIPILSAHGNGPQRPLQVIGVDGHSW